MAVVIVLSRTDRREEKQEFLMKEKLILGKSIYCDIRLDDRLIANIQCEITTTKSGQLIAQNLDLKKNILLNQDRLKKSALKATDVLKIGPFEISINQNKLTSEETNLLNSEYEEMV